jgi:hypothetical protein
LYVISYKLAEKLDKASVELLFVRIGRNVVISIHISLLNVIQQLVMSIYTRIDVCDHTCVRRHILVEMHIIARSVN